MHFRFSWRVSLICLLLASGMVRAAIWQWDRHIEKLSYIEQLTKNLREPIQRLEDLFSTGNVSWEKEIFRRVVVEGEFDFEHEMVLRNRRYNEQAGVYVVTPLKLKQGGGAQYLLVNRGFIPLSKSERSHRAIFHTEKTISFIGLIKEPRLARYMLSPRDPWPSATKWNDSWIRIDPERMGKQLPYKLLPFYVEVMKGVDPEVAEKEIIVAGSGREEMLILGLNESSNQNQNSVQEEVYPIPTFDTVIPAARHLGYVYEWSFMALITILIGVVLQLRRPTVPLWAYG